MSGRNASVHVFVPGDMLAIALGADDIAARIRAEAEARSIDITLIRNGSRGICWAEPLVEVQCAKGRMAYGNICADDVSELFDADFVHGGAHTKALGKTDDIAWLAKQERVMFARCGMDDPLCMEYFIANGGFAGLHAALDMAAAQIIGAVLQSGLRGRGGAGFPAGIKWKTVADAGGPVKHIVCNADEGDSGTFADRIMMEADPYRLIEAMIIAGIATGAEHGVIYIRSEYPFAVRMMKQAIIKAKTAKYLGKNIQGSGKNFAISVFVGAGSYVCGEETALLESLEGRPGIVRNKPPLPAIEGLYGQPTLIHNVLSLCAVPDILIKGAAWYAKLGMGRSTGTLAFQLAGNVAKGGLVELPFGRTLRELVEGFGGGTKDGTNVRAVQIGGPLGAYLPDQLLDTPMDYEQISEIGAGIGHGGIVVFGQGVNMRKQAEYAFAFCAEESCGKCTPCRIGSLRGAELLAAKEPDMALLDELCAVMVEGSACAMGSMTPIPVQSAIQHFAEDFTRTDAKGDRP